MLETLRGTNLQQPRPTSRSDSWCRFNVYSMMFGRRTSSRLKGFGIRNGTFAFSGVEIGSDFADFLIGPPMAPDIRRRFAESIRRIRR
jgi:hypothetical protein